MAAPTGLRHCSAIRDNSHGGDVMASRRRLVSGGATLAAASLLAPVLSGGTARADTALAVSFGKVDITPDVGGFMAGYGVDVPRASTGTFKPLFARCIIIWDSGYPNVVVTADVLAFPRS